MPRRFWPLLVLALLGQVSIAPADELDEYVGKSMARQHIPGLSLVVIRDGRIIKQQGCGQASVEHGVPATPDTVYDLASMTKPFVATAAMLLVQDGKLSLDDRIDKYLDKLPETWQGITVRQLLSHTAGIPDYLRDLRQDFPHQTPPEQIVEAATKAALSFEPGQRWSYSNTGYIVLGMIIHKVSGQTYDQLLRDRVFQPLNMAATRRHSPDEVVPHRASGYLWYGLGGLHNGDFLRYLMTDHGDRGLLSTANDLAKWDAALNTEGILSAASKVVTWTPMKLGDGATADYGLGWFVDSVNGHRRVHHAGGAPGTATMISRYPDDHLTVILLTNGGAAYIQGLEFGVAQRYLPDLVPWKAIELPISQLDACTGYYNAFGSQLLKITREDGKLVLDDGGRFANAFVPLSESEFVAEDADRGFTLRRDSDGQLLGLNLRLVKDEMQVDRIGPLFGAVATVPDPDPVLTVRVEGVLKAFAAGGKAVEEVSGVAPQARADYAHGPAPELAGIRELAFVAAQDVGHQHIERHGAKVSRVLYGRMLMGARSRNVLVYLTADGLVTDQDILSE